LQQQFHRRATALQLLHLALRCDGSLQPGASTFLVLCCRRLAPVCPLLQLLKASCSGLGSTSAVVLVSDSLRNSKSEMTCVKLLC